jgi:hypothetical protein
LEDFEGLENNFSLLIWQPFPMRLETRTTPCFLVFFLDLICKICDELPKIRYLLQDCHLQLSTQVGSNTSARFGLQGNF